jgi:uncharacterized protein YyaL (SSP411 family)
MPNQLIHESSPYLLQHADNPVDWMPWTDATLEKARREDKPIFLSIGYAACHWCHVMAHESFESQDIALLLNQSFICIKVDREERPDVDSIYMDAVVAMTGSGGWPMSVFLTPEGQPFYGGTYFPPFPRYGMPAFRDVIQAAARAWREDRQELRKSGENLTAHLTSATYWKASPDVTVRSNLVEQSLQALLGAYDWQRGGWGRAPLFPQPMSIEFLLLQASRGNRQSLEAARHSLRAMSLGGMYDVVGGGFHRYSTDEIWLVPHFEKMLYDNAQLASAYLHAYLLGGDEGFRRTTQETLDFILRELTHPEGGFYSSLDADSEGEEGKYYFWDLAELREILEAADLDLLAKVYPLSREGNFEGHTILQRRAELGELSVAMNMSLTDAASRLDQIHARLLAARSKRIRPQTDDKVLVSWNAFALRALAEAARYLNRPDYLAAAQRNAHFLLTALRPAGHLMRSWRDGLARHDAFLEDYAALILGLLSLYQSDPDPRWYAEAEELGAEMVATFRDPEGGFFDSRPEAISLYIRPKNNLDNATPCGNSLAALALLQLSEYNGSAEWRSLAEAPFGALQDTIVRNPTAFGQWLQALDFIKGPVAQVVLVGAPGDPALNSLRDELWQTFRPRLVAAFTSPQPQGGPALINDRPLVGGQAAAYVCRGFACQLPVTTPAELGAQLK